MIMGYDMAAAVETLQEKDEIPLQECVSHGEQRALEEALENLIAMIQNNEEIRDDVKQESKSWQ